MGLKSEAEHPQQDRCFSTAVGAPEALDARDRGDSSLINDYTYYNLELATLR